GLLVVPWRLHPDVLGGPAFAVAAIASVFLAMAVGANVRGTVGPQVPLGVAQRLAKVVEANESPTRPFGEFLDVANDAVDLAANRRHLLGPLESNRCFVGDRLALGVQPLLLRSGLFQFGVVARLTLLGWVPNLGTLGAVANRLPALGYEPVVARAKYGVGT